MFCHQRIDAPHLGQCEGGLTIDSPRGTRQTTTLRKLATKAPRTITVAKKTINGYRGDDFAVSLNRENTLCHYASRSEDSQEGKAAMREKRQPKFQNR